MAAILGYDPEACLSVPGRLVLAPTTTTPPAYGGTPLGYVEAFALVKETEFAYAMSESLGIDRAKTYRGATKAYFVFTLVQFDKTGYNQLWAYSTTSSGGFADANVLSLPQPGRSLQPGLVAPSTPLLFAADDPQHPSCVLYAPAWCDELRQRLALVLNRPLASLVVVNAGLGVDPNDSTKYRDLAFGRLQDLALS